MAFVLLFSQIFLFLFLFLFSNLFNLFSLIHLVIILLLGLVVGLWGLFTLGRTSYSPLPIPKRKNKFIKKGIYKYIRHPVYLGLIIIAFSLLLSRFILPATIGFILFAIITNLKANMEERLLEEKHPKYKEYKRKTSKFVPFIY